jgi:hypothetical protein
MRRVKGAGKNAIILCAGVLAGSFMLLRVPTTPRIADAAQDRDAAPPVFSEQPPINELVADFRPDSQPDAPDETSALGENPVPGSGSDILSDKQKQRLQEASLGYIALTPEEGVQMARSFNIVKEGGDPTNICGPLSLAILRDAGLVDPYIKIRNFWLLNPNANRKLLDQTFPPERYDHFQFSTPLNEMDWESFPLRAGDFLYIYAGAKGTFEHMLTVTRVDDAGRAYSVTNHATPDGFVIDEVMLYDPARPGLGQFSEWTNRQNAKIGTTGFGGFELWRLAQPIQEKDPRLESLTRDLDAVMLKSGGDWYVVIKDLNGGMLYERQAAVPVDVGSMIKLPVAMLFFKSLELEGVQPVDLDSYLKEEGPGITYEQLLRAMFHKSDLFAARLLLAETRLAGLNVEKELQEWGLKETSLDLRKMSARDLTTLYEGLYSGEWIDPAARNYLLLLMDETPAAKGTRLGILEESNPSSLEFYNRRGSTLDTIIAMGDSAVVSVPVVDGEDAFIVVMHGFYSDYSPATDQGLIQAVEEMAQVLWVFARK